MYSWAYSESSEVVILYKQALANQTTSNALDKVKLHLAQSRNIGDRKQLGRVLAAGSDRQLSRAGGADTASCNVDETCPDSKLLLSLPLPRAFVCPSFSVSLFVSVAYYVPIALVSKNRRRSKPLKAHPPWWLHRLQQNGWPTDG